MFLTNLLANRFKTSRELIVFVQYDIHQAGYYDTHPSRQNYKKCFMD